MRLILCAVLGVFALGPLPGCASAPRNAPPSAPDRLAPPATAAAARRDAGVLDTISALPADLFAADTFTAPDGTTLRYRLLPPLDPRPGVRYPLVVVFHGSGVIGTDNLAQLSRFPKTWAREDVRRRYPAYVLAPQFPERSAVYSGSEDDPGRSSIPGPPLPAALDLIDALQARLPIDSARVYAIGFSMGASAVWNALALRPDLFAAAVPIAGVPNPAAADRVARTPVWVIHGNADTENPIGPDRGMVETLRARPGAEVRFWEMDGMGHDIPPALLAGDALMEWLFAHS